jgi:hypothetical protein
VKLPVPEYGVVPPVALTVTVVVPPLHEIDPADEVALRTADSNTETLVTEVHPFASVTV